LAGEEQTRGIRSRARSESPHLNSLEYAHVACQQL
jgi:hypothetical protein